jgi:hypothetical protein
MDWGRTRPTGGGGGVSVGACAFTGLRGFLERLAKNLTSSGKTNSGVFFSTSGSGESGLLFDTIGRKRRGLMDVGSPFVVVLGIIFSGCGHVKKALA